MKSQWPVGAIKNYIPLKYTNRKPLNRKPLNLSNTALENYVTNSNICSVSLYWY